MSNPYVNLGHIVGDVGDCRGHQVTTPIFYSDLNLEHGSF